MPTVTDDFVPPEPGMVVCDCWYNHQSIVSVDDDGDTVTLQDGLICSFIHCCDPPDHVHNLSPMPDDWRPLCAYRVKQGLAP